MNAYLYLLLFVLTGTVLSFSLKEKKILNTLFIIASLWVIGLVAFRNEILGVDTSDYCYHFLHPDPTYKDPGFELYNSIIRIFTHNKDWYIAITALLSIAPVMYVIWKDSSNKFFSLFIFITLGTTIIYYVLYFAAMRQCLAVGMILLLAHFVNNGEIKSIYTIILLNVLIGLVHSAAFLVIPFFLLNKFTFKKWIVCVALAISFVIGMYVKNFSEYVILINGITNDRFDYYLNYMEDAEYMMLATLPMMIIAAAITLMVDDRFRNDIYYKMFIIGVVINNILEMAADSSRLTLFFLISSCLVFPNWLSHLSVKNKQLIKMGFVFIILSYYSYRYIGIWDRLDPDANMVPYKTNSILK